jgi:hypothetical protein
MRQIMQIACHVAAQSQGENIIERKTLGLAVIGSGRIGGLRAQLADLQNSLGQQPKK